MEVPTNIVESSRTCPPLMVSKDLLPLFQCSYCKQGPFHGLFGAMFFTFLCFWLVILLFKMTPEHKMLFCAPEYKKSVMWRKYTLAHLQSGMRVSPVGCEFHVHESVSMK